MPEQDELQKQQIMQFMTTEHFTLQTARSATIAEANGRTNLFLASVSSGVVALAFIGQASDMNETFLMFALVLFGCLFFLGIATFVRVRQTGIEDMICSRGINRIRHYYQEVAPEMKHYFIQSSHDEMWGMMQNMGVRPTYIQQFVSTAGVVMVSNSVIAGVFVALLLSTFTEFSLLGYSLIGIGTFMAVIYLHGRCMTRQCKR